MNYPMKKGAYFDHEIGINPYEYSVANYSERINPNYGWKSHINSEIHKKFTDIVLNKINLQKEKKKTFSISNTLSNSSNCTNYVPNYNKCQSESLYLLNETSRYNPQTKRSQNQIVTVNPLQSISMQTDQNGTMYQLDLLKEESNYLRQRLIHQINRKHCKQIIPKKNRPQ